MRKVYTLALLLAAAFVMAPGAAADSPLDALKGVLGSVIGGSGTATTIAEGNYAYSGPAVTFKSDNALKNLGGAAAGATIEAKIKPYYAKLGIDKMTFTAGADSTFEMKVRKVTFKGTIEYGNSGECVLHMDGIGKVLGGKFNARWQMVGNTLTLTFDATRLMELLSKIAAATGKSSLGALSSVMNSYDGAYLGFRLDKQK